VQPGPADWPAHEQEWAALWRTRTRDEWAELLGGTDACVQPVLDWAEARQHPHLRARGTHVELDGVAQPAPAPRFSRTAAAVQRRPPVPGEHTADLARELGLSDDDLQSLLDGGAAGHYVPHTPTEEST